MRGRDRSPSPRLRRWGLAGTAIAASARALAVGVHALGAQELAYWGTVQGTAGDYGLEQHSSSVALLNGLTLDRRALRLSLSVPLLRQSTPWITTTLTGANSGGATTAVVDTSVATEVGIGDPLLSGSLAFVRESSRRPEVRLVVALKAPVGSVTRGLGTGEWDGSAGLSFAKMLGGTLLLADASYWMRGDMPGVELPDVVSWGAAVGRPLGTGRWALLGSLYGSGPAVAGGTAPVQTALTLSRFGDGGRFWSTSVGVGLTQAAPSISASFGWQVSLRRMRLAESRQPAAVIAP